VTGSRHRSPIGRQPVGAAEGDLLIGADGIHSPCARQLYPWEIGGSSTATALRGVVEAIRSSRTTMAVVGPIAPTP